MAHLVFLNRCYPPEFGATGRVLERIAHRLSERYRVTILAGRPINSELESVRQEDSMASRTPLEGAIEVIRVPNSNFSHQSLHGRIINYLSYLVLVGWRCLWLRPKPDIIIAMTDPPLACLVGYLVACARKIKFLYNIQDLHPDMALASGMVSRGVLVTLWERLHRWVMQRAHGIIVLSEDMGQKVQAKGIKDEKISVIPNPCPHLDLPNVQPNDHPVIKEIRSTAAFVIVYSGNLGFAGGWARILEAVRLLDLDDEKDIRVVLIGGGTQREMIAAQAEHLKQVALFSFKPEKDWPYILCAGDLYLVAVRSGLEGLVMPSKIYALLAAGCPILAVVPRGSDVAKIVEDGKCGLWANPDDPQSIKQAIVYARNNPSELVQMKKRAREISKQFTEKEILKKYWMLLERHLK